MLHVVTAISNPERYSSRNRLYWEFEKHMRESGVRLTTVECVNGDRPFEVTRPGNPQHVQLRTDGQIWLKENLLNIGISRLPLDAEYVALIDADLQFIRPDWPRETVQQLQHFSAVQMFQSVQYVGPAFTVLNNKRGFMDQWVSGDTFLMGGVEARNPNLFAKTNPTTEPCGAPGGAWAFRRSALDKVGGLLDFSLVGSADYFMAAAMIGKVENSITRPYGASFKSAVRLWASRAERHIGRNAGVVGGTVLHHWHGRINERGYHHREQILWESAFDPVTDLIRDTQGVIGLNDDGSERIAGLRDKLRAYFRSRNEDCNSA